MPNKTERRGRGLPRARITIQAAEGAELRRLLEKRHGYSPEEAVAGLLSGELATVLLPDEHRWALARWLDGGMTATDLPDVRDTLKDVIEQVTR